MKEHKVKNVKKGFSIIDGNLDEFSFDSWFTDFSRWKKCKTKISVLSYNPGGKSRPGQSGTTGQLFFSKCGDPPEGCECVYEEPSGTGTLHWVFSCFHESWIA